MKVWFSITVLYFLYFVSASTFYYLSANAKSSEVYNTRKPGRPLILTPLINEGKVDEARAAAEVKFTDFKDVKSYAAYLTVNKQYDSNLFFWFVPSKVDYKNAPVVLRLVGGPGCSALMSLFMENGPFEITSEAKLEQREYAWTTHHSVIYIDNPVGVGFSFTNDGGFAENQTIVGDQIYIALLQFFQVFPELRKNPFYVVGDSYGCKFASAVSYTVHKNNPFNKDQHINLQGIAIGNGWCDPVNHLLYADYLYQLGLLDSNARMHLQNVQDDIGKHISNKQWHNATTTYLDSFLKYFLKQSGFENWHNYLSSKDAVLNSITLLTNYLQREDVRAALHVDNATFIAVNDDVFEYLFIDIMQSVAPWISELLSHYRMLFYNGQLDIIVAYPLTVNFLRQLDFSAADEYKTASRYKWMVNSEIAGYVKQAGNLTEVLVRNAGHTVALDQPRWGLDLITKFTHNQIL